MYKIIGAYIGTSLWILGKADTEQVGVLDIDQGWKWGGEVMPVKEKGGGN